MQQKAPITGRADTSQSTRGTQNDIKQQPLQLHLTDVPSV